MFPPHNTSGAVANPKGINLIQVYHVDADIRGDIVHQPFISIACMHCEDPPCRRVCPTGAISKEPDTQITLVDQEKCIGCKACLWVCPYGAPSFDDDGNLVLCDLCMDRLKEGKKTACEAACQAGAIHVGTPEEISELQSRKAVDRIAKGTIL
jgi:Fe-S-cluster-containing dehydrogenase component